MKRSFAIFLALLVLVPCFLGCKKAPIEYGILCGQLTYRISANFPSQQDRGPIKVYAIATDRKPKKRKDFGDSVTDVKRKKWAIQPWIEDGSYEIEQVPVGEYLVIFVSANCEQAGSTFYEYAMKNERIKKILSTVEIEKLSETIGIRLFYVKFITVKPNQRNYVNHLFTMS